MNRYVERKNEFQKALARLNELLNQEENEIVVDATIHRFEFTFELAWKTMKDYLEYQGIVESIGSPREIIKLSFKHNLIDDGEKWIEMMLARNSLAHIYDEQTSRIIYINIKNNYVELLGKFAKELENL